MDGKEQFSVNLMAICERAATKLYLVLNSGRSTWPAQVSADATAASGSAGFVLDPSEAVEEAAFGLGEQIDQFLQ